MAEAQAAQPLRFAFCRLSRARIRPKTPAFYAMSLNSALRTHKTPAVKKSRVKKSRTGDPPPSGGSLLGAQLLFR